MTRLSDEAAPPRAWMLWISALLAAGLCMSAVMQLRHVSTEALAMIQQLTPAAWAAFALLYLAQPIADAAIFHRLWRLPFTEFRVLLRKSAINEVLFGYAGEIYFYVWAKRRARLSGVAFAAIKDVNILSALASAIQTLLLLACAAIVVKRIDLGRELGPFLWPSLAFVAVSLGVVAFARRVFSLDRGALLTVSAIHGLRLAAATGLTVLLWMLALPQVEIEIWVALLASRMLLARLPFVANKELVFANLLLLLLGPRSPAALLLTTLAIATLLTHLIVLAATSAPSLKRAALKILEPRSA